jgi:hypothetical protein
MVFNQIFLHVHSIKGLKLQVKCKNVNTKPHSLANFVGCVVGFLDVLNLYACGASSLPPRYPLNAVWYKGDILK